MKEQIKKRTQKLAIDVWRLCKTVPKSREYNAYVNQLLRCSSSVGANYRAAQRSKSTADFVYKLKIVEEEADECLYFFEILSEIRPELKPQIQVLETETNEILSIIIASIRTARKKINP